uniref:Sulfotransferase domain-containing protein n=1 Tax=Aureoumbra lagunensis TaxID=44058 RepID=A0A7S3K5Z6_9STRA
MTGIGSARASRRAEYRHHLSRQAEKTKAAVAESFESSRKSSRRQNGWTLILKEKLFRITRSQWQRICMYVQRQKKKAIDIPSSLSVLFFVLVLLIILMWRPSGKIEKKDIKNLFDSIKMDENFYEIEWLMVIGEKKSGATYVRQLLLDNLFVDPLDTIDFDHHQNPPAAARRLSEFGEVIHTISRDNPSSLNKLASTKNILVLFVTKEPISFLVSSLQRPHPDDGAKKREIKDTTILKALLRKRSVFSNEALALKKMFKYFEHIKYEDALLDPDLLVRTLAHKYNFHRRRGNELLIPHHFTGDITTQKEDNNIQFHGQARRARYRQLGTFDRRNYYLDNQFLDYLDDSLIKHIRHRLLDTHLESFLGYARIHHTTNHISHNLKHKTENISFHFPWRLLLFIENIFIYTFFAASFILLALAPAIYFRLTFFHSPTVIKKNKKTTPYTIANKTPTSFLPAPSSPHPSSVPSTKINMSYNTSSGVEDTTYSPGIPVFSAPVVPSERRQADPGAYFAMWGGAPPLPGDLDSSSSSSSAEDDITTDDEEISSDSDDDDLHITAAAGFLIKKNK